MWKIKLYATTSGKSPVIDFVENLQLIEKAKVRNTIRLLAEFGPQLRLPYSKKLTGYKKLYELRTMGSSPIRLIYTIIDGTFYILHGFIKKSNQTPKKEIKTAEQRQSILT